jgi:DeoR family fructose operon transcriptional repressor
VIGVGGELDPASGSFVGSAAEKALEELFVDVAFMSTKGFIPREGTFESAMPTLQVKRVVARRCQRLVLLVDHGKIGKRSLTRVLDTAQIHEVVTDDGASRSDLAALRQLEIPIHVAPRAVEKLAGARRAS